ncbi:MAG: pitrilysin family protein [Candidatus Peregrinibacteria bacterium]
MFSQKTFSNGLRLITSASEGTQSLTLLILVGAGSRYESEKERGIAHFLEHMFFKGAEKFKNAQEVAQAIDGVGGDFNAFTGKEYAGYYVKVAAEKKEIAFEVLSDMLLHSRFDPEEIEKERGVILEELNMYEDMPTYKIGWDFEELLFDGHPMAWDQIGTKEVIKSVTQEDFKRYKRDLYTPENTVIIASGNIFPAQAEALTAQYFCFPEEKKSRTVSPFSWNIPKNPLFIREKKTEQAHLVIGFPSIAHDDPRKYAESILAILLGGNMSSRMFLNIREARGLCYSISTSTDRYSDCGIFSTRAGVDITRTEEAVSAIIAEYEKLRIEAPLADEIERAKNYLKGKITLRMEDSEEVASFLGTQSLLLNEVETIDEYFAKIDAVTSEEIFALSQEIFAPEKRAMAMIGPFSDQEAIFKKLLQGNL